MRERRNQLTHPAYTKPELLAVRANEVWSWDITKLRGPGKWTYFHLYVTGRSSGNVTTNSAPCPAPSLKAEIVPP